MKPRFVPILITFFLCGQGLQAQSVQYRFSRVDINQGLSNNQVKCFLKDRKGFVWVGTISGLNRYDGYDVKTFQNNSQDTTSILDNDVSRLFEDPNGNMWVTTASGQSVYDPALERFSRNTTQQLRQFGVPGGVITIISKESKGKYWFVHSTLGLYLFDPVSRSTVKLEHVQADTTTIMGSPISSIAEDPNGDVWLLHSDGIFEKLDGKTHQVVYRNHSIHMQFINAPHDYNMIIDSDGDLWIYLINSNKGIFYFNGLDRQLLHFDKNSKRVKLNTDIVHGLVQDNSGLIWIATDHGGLNLLDKKDFSVRVILHNSDDELSLVQNSIQTIYKDYDGFIWIGTYKKGVNYYHEDVIRFQLLKYQMSDKLSLPFNDVNCFAEDNYGNLWIGTNGGGLIYYNRKQERFTRYLNDPDNTQSLSSNVIVSLCLDRRGKLWIGTYYGGLNCFDGKKFIRYKHNPGNPKTISDDNIWEIFEDSQGKLWIGTLSAGLDIFDPISETFSHYRAGDFNSIHSTYIASITEDQEGNIWIGTGYGVDLFERQTGRFIQYLNDPANPNSLANNSVHKILDDGHGNIWIGTKEGLNQFNKRTKTFKVFRQDDGLPHNTIFSILEDKRNNLWVSTPKGLSNLIMTRNAHGEVGSFYFKNYDEFDGLQGNQFNDDAGFKTRSGELVFGGSGGFNIFHPEDISPNERKPFVVLTGIQIYNKQISIGEKVNGRVLLEKSASALNELTLNHSDNVFSIEFAALSFFHPKKSQYKYKLEGFNKDWLFTNNQARQVTFTNLDPGEYVFQVKASNNDGVWNDEATKLKIVVLPPFWKSRTAFVIYMIVILTTLLLTRRLIQHRERMKFALERERHEAQQLHELDMMKIKFFTNVSHEFRTPLTLILTPIEKLLKYAKEPEQLSQFQLIHRNARRLLNLVNQLLDFRKLEVQEIKFNPSEGDVIQFIRESVLSFSDLSEKKDIQLDFKTSIASLEMVFDPDKLEKILLNLLSNAFKFTPEHGRVSTEVSVVSSEEGQHLIIKIIDNGIGIAADKQDKIFERFFQSDLPRSMINQGSGIGLSITAEFVKVHEGTVTVTSELGRGSCFTVTLPVKAVTGNKEAINVSEFQVEPVPDSTKVNDKAEKIKLPILLLVEDNEDFRFYLKDNLKSNYRIIEAGNGNEGWSKALAELPDLIVSDVMMPEMNGIELCRKIKSDPRVSHCPVILLTARTAEEQKLEGFESGADDYVTKPFNFEILQSRIKNLILQRESFQKDFRRQIDVKASSLTITSLDEKLIQNAIKCVEENISDADFSVEDLSHQLGMSRVHLYKKLISLTGKSPLEFIRTIRLQQAAQLLEKSQLSVSEVAYKVGFNSPKYFTKYFKEEYRVLPSAYASSKRQ